MVRSNASCVMVTWDHPSPPLCEQTNTTKRLPSRNFVAGVNKLQQFFSVNEKFF